MKYSSERVCALLERPVQLDFCVGLSGLVTFSGPLNRSPIFVSSHIIVRFNRSDPDRYFFKYLAAVLLLQRIMLAPRAITKVPPGIGEIKCTTPTSKITDPRIKVSIRIATHYKAF